jgi:predicted site-specific integrase-resolvase
MFIIIKTYSIGGFAERIGRSTQTVRRWEREGKLIAKRHPSGHRYFDESDVRSMLGGAPKAKSTIVYCRVSSAGQKNDLAAQVNAMETYCLGAGNAVDEWVKEIGGGMNFKRKRFLDIMDRMQRGEIEKLLVAHKDRLVRFGFDLIAHIATANGCEIVVVNQSSLSPQQEMVEDLLSIVHTFSCRLYGVHKYKNQLRDDYPDIKVSEPRELLY